LLMAMCSTSTSRDLFKFWTITYDVSETVQYREIVAIAEGEEISQKAACGL